MMVLFFCFKQKTAYEMRISDWSSDVCSSDLIALAPDERTLYVAVSDKEVAGVYAYPLDAAGDVGDRRRLFDARPMLGKDAPGITDGLKVAADGPLFFPAQGGLVVMKSPPPSSRSEDRRLGKEGCSTV